MITAMLLKFRIVITSYSIHYTKLYDGVKAYNIGKLGSPNGDIEAGYSFIDKRIIDSLNQRIEVLKEKLGHLTKLPEYRKTEKRKVLIDQIQEAITKAEEELRKKNSNLYKAKDATRNNFV